MKHQTPTLLFVLLKGTSALPHSAIFPSSHQLHPRQAIPDSSGQTGNVPAIVRPVPPPRLPTPSSTSTFTSSTTIPTLTCATPHPTSTTTPPAEILKLTPTTTILSPATLAGIITGSTLLFLLLLTLLLIILRRRRRPEIIEIPIRRSKLGSRLRHRVFNSPLSGSRSSSRASTRELTGELRKGNIGRPVPVGAPARWGEGEMLRVPGAALVRENWERGERGERWGRPVRPRSAEPLGRLSGMGLGMGYLR